MGSAGEAGGTVAVDHELDARHVECPIPLLLTKRELRRLKPGQVLKIVATDPSAAMDLYGYCYESGNEYIDSCEVNGEYITYVRKQG